MGPERRVAPWLDQGGLGLPDREYYFREEHLDVRLKYQQYVQAQGPPGEPPQTPPPRVGLWRIPCTRPLASRLGTTCKPLRKCQAMPLFFGESDHVVHVVGPTPSPFCIFPYSIPVCRSAPGIPLISYIFRSLWTPRFGLLQIW